MTFYRFSIFLIFFFISNSVISQNTGGVFSPVVKDGHRSFEYRATADPGSDDMFGLAQRFHYQHALNGDFMMRGIAQVKKADGSDTDLDYVQVELFWDLGEESSAYRTGFRFDLRARDDNRSNQAGVNWIHRYQFYDTWELRAIILSSTQFGQNARNGINLQSRWRVTRKLGDKQSIGIALFNSLGNTEAFGQATERTQELGPMYIRKFAGGWALYTGVLFGLNENTDDMQLRFRLACSM